MSPKFYIAGDGFEVLPGVFVEKGTKLYSLKTFRGRMQKIAFNWAYSYVGAIKNYDEAIKRLKKITKIDSELYYPSSFGFVTSQQAIINDINGFINVTSDASVWFPANGWCYDETKKFGVVGSNGKKKNYYNFMVEVQFRQTTKNNVKACTNDNWSFFVDYEQEKFYQIKEWLDGRVRRLQAENINGTPTLVLDFNNINAIPYPPITPGKENCINPVIVKSGCAQ